MSAATAGQTVRPSARALGSIRLPRRSARQSAPDRRRAAVAAAVRAQTGPSNDAERPILSIDRRGLLLGAAGTAGLLAAGRVEAAPSSVYDFTVTQFEKPVSLSQFKDCVTVFVNVASE
mmetsp:Transcript_10933/g.28041  ORF Transcript_10933/g.28041 Transcript_10933/m.28041 type:complete len:119 (-) Transcript_10933:46-402(-)